MTNKRNKMNLSIHISLFIICIYILYSFTPMLASNYYIGAGLFVLWIFVSVFDSSILTSFLLNKKNYIVYLWITYSIILKVIGFSKASWGNYFTMIMFFFPYIVYNAYKENISLEAKKKILLFSYYLRFDAKIKLLSALSLYSM